MDEEDEYEDDFVTIPKEKYDSMIEDLLTMAELIDMVSVSYTHLDVYKRQDDNFSNNVILTQTEGLTMNSRPKQPKYARNKNILVIGGSRCV